MSALCHRRLPLKPITLKARRVIDRIPYRSEFDALRCGLSQTELGAMAGRIKELIDEAGSEIATAGWLPGSDWTGTPFAPRAGSPGVKAAGVRAILRRRRAISSVG